MSRPSSDRPVNDPLSRTGHIQKSSIDDDTRRLIIGYPGYGKQPGDNPMAADLRNQGERTPTSWHQEAGVWRPQLPRSSTASNQAVHELLVDARSTSLNPPTTGWNMSTKVFGAQYGVAPEPSTPHGLSTNPVRIAWHPTGYAVLVAPIDANGDIEIWEWVAGAGFGRKYVPVHLWEADDDLQMLYNDFDFRYPRVDQFGGEYAFHPGGNFLAIGGSAGRDFSNQPQPLMVARFDMANGLEVMHPQYPTASQAAIADVSGIAWHPTGNWIAAACDGTPFIRVWPVNSSGFPQAAVAAPGGTPSDPGSKVAWNHAGTFIALGTFGSDGTDNPHAWPWVTGFGTKVAAPASPLGVGEEVQGLSWHPNDQYLLVVGVGGPVYVWGFNPSGAGAWGTRTLVEDLNALGLTPLGGAFNNDGSMFVVLAEAGGTTVVRLYSFSGGVGAFVQELELTGVNSAQVLASVAWRP